MQVQPPVIEGTTLVDWVLGGATAVISILAGAIAAMWHHEKQSNRERIDALEKSSKEHIDKLESKLIQAEAAERVCRESHERLLIEFTRIETRLAYLENHGIKYACPSALDCPIKPGK